MGILGAVFSEVGGPLLGILAAIGAAIGALFIGKSKGKAEAEVKHAQQNAARDVAAAKQEVETLKESQNVQSEINQMPAGSAADKLRESWTRD